MLNKANALITHPSGPLHNSVGCVVLCRAGKGTTCPPACHACLSAMGRTAAAQVCEAAEVACEDVLEHEQTGALPSLGSLARY